MSMNEAQAWVLIIAAVGGILVTLVASVVTGVLTFVSREKLGAIKDAQIENQASNATKLEVIHQATNGGLTALQKQLESQAAEIVSLKAALLAMTATANKAAAE